MTKTEIEQALSDLHSAKIALLSGKLKQRVKYADKEVTYAATDSDKIEQAMRDLRTDLAALSRGGRRHGAARPGLG